MSKKYISENAELIKEWDWEKNKDLDPTKTTKGSHKIAHWKCPKCGYSWKSLILTRTRKKNPAHCPCCMNRVVVKGINDLATARPDLVKEWHPTKNGNLTPYMVTAGSSKRVWWKCSVCGKDWNTVISSRRTCPHCLHAPKRGADDLSTVFPQIAKEWHPTKNGDLSPADVKTKSNKKVWWRCPVGHDYQAAVCARTRLEKNGLLGTGCPVCNKMNRTSFPEQAIFYYVKQLYPDAISQYREKFLGIMELDIYIPSIRYAIEYDGERWHKKDKLSREQRKYFKCVKQGIKLIRIKENLSELGPDTADEHIGIIEVNGKRNLEATIKYLIKKINFTNKRINVNLEQDELKIREGYQTKVRDSVTDLYPDLVKEWHPTKNGSLTPTNCKAGSSYKVWWKCSKCGYEWKTSISKRTLGKHGCLNCAQQAAFAGLNDLETLFPQIAKEWHPTKNAPLTPRDIRPKSNRMYWWKCSVCGHEWKSSAQNRIGNRAGCPACSGRVPKTGINDLFTVCPELKKEWDFEKNKHLDPSRLGKGSNTKAWWKCPKGHSYEMMIKRKSAGAGCHYCSSHKVLTGFNDFQTAFPDIAKEWDYEKNVGKAPNKYTKHSSEKVWWKCPKGHSYQMTIHQRASGGSCPICSNHKLLVGFNDLSTLYPDLAKEWDYEKNGNLRPTDIISKTKKKAWWKCSKCNHSWQTSVIDRVYGTGCPKCSPKRRVETFKKNIVRKKGGLNDPILLREWNYEKNGGLLPENFTAHSNRKVWWKCPKGHEYQKTIDKRTQGSGCSYCSGRHVLAGFNDLETLRPDLAKEWNYEKNKNMKPTDFVLGSNQKVWWRCSVCKTSWQTKILARTKKNAGCPKCGVKKRIEEHRNTFIKKNGCITDPLLLKEWNYKKNFPLTPQDFTPASNKPVWWICSKCGYEWKAKIGNRSLLQRGCPCCANHVVVKGKNDLETTHPQLAKEWHPSQNKDLTPSMVSHGTSKKVWWICSKGHSYEMTINHRSSGGNCPYCSNSRVLKGFNDLATKFPEIAKEWCYEKNLLLTPGEVLPGSEKKVWWKCSNCGHEWRAEVYRRVKGSKCPCCHGLPQLPMK